MIYSEWQRRGYTYYETRHVTGLVKTIIITSESRTDCVDVLTNIRAKKVDLCVHRCMRTTTLSRYTKSQIMKNTTTTSRISWRWNSWNSKTNFGGKFEVVNGVNCVANDRKNSIPWKRPRRVPVDFQSVVFGGIRVRNAECPFYTIYIIYRT